MAAFLGAWLPPVGQWNSVKPLIGLALGCIQGPICYKTLLHRTTTHKLHRVPLMTRNGCRWCLVESVPRNTSLRQFMLFFSYYLYVYKHLLILILNSHPQEILCSYQASLCSSLWPLHLQRRGSRSAQQDPKRSRSDERRPEDPSQRLGEAQLILRPGADFLQR